MTSCLLFPSYGATYAMPFAGGPTRRSAAPDQHNIFEARAEVAFDEEVNWQEVKGKQAKVTVGLLKHILMARFAALGIAAEAFRAILRILFVFS